MRAHIILEDSFYLVISVLNGCTHVPESYQQHNDIRSITLPAFRYT